MTDVLVCLQVGFENLTNMHCVFPVRGDVDWCFNCASQLEFVRFDWNDTNEWHLNDELLGVLVVKTVLIHVPLGSLKE